MKRLRKTIRITVFLLLGAIVVISMASCSWTERPDWADTLLRSPTHQVAVERMAQMSAGKPVLTEALDIEGYKRRYSQASPDIAVNDAVHAVFSELGIASLGGASSPSGIVLRGQKDEFVIVLIRNEPGTWMGYCTSSNGGPLAHEVMTRLIALGSDQSVSTRVER